MELFKSTWELVFGRTADLEAKWGQCDRSIALIATGGRMLAELLESRHLLSNPTTPIPGITGPDAPAITAQYTDGSSFTLPTVNQPILVMDFWASWCGWCMKGMPDTQALSSWAQQNGKPVKVVAVNLQESLATITATWTANNFTLPVAMDTTGSIFGSYAGIFGYNGIPLTIVVAGNKITWNRCGYSPTTETELENEINRISALLPQGPLDIGLSGVNIAENQAVGTAVGSFSATDTDVSSTFTYALVAGTGGDDNASFSINGDQLVANSTFDYETKNSYSIRVRTTDSGGLTLEKVFTIGVTNANEAPTDLSLSNSSVAETLPAGRIVGNLAPTDPDAGNTFTYSLVAGIGSADNASFILSGNQLKTNASFDYESRNSYSIRVRATDQGGLSFENVFTISVINVNEAPTNVMLSAASVAENQPIGTGVGTLTTADADAGDTYIYTLVAGTGSTDNASFIISGDQLTTNASFNCEAKSSYSIRVRTADAGGLYFEKALTIGVLNVNEAPTDLALSNSSVAEHQPLGATVGTVSTTDPDVGDTFSYALVTGAGSTDNASFVISGNQLTTATSFDYGTKSGYSVRVRTTDAGGQSFEKAVAIAVSNVNESPIDIAVSNSSVAENQPMGTVVGNLTTSDPDGGGSFTYSLVAGAGSSDNVSFVISGNQLKSNSYFNFETRSSYAIRLRATDSGGLWTEKAFTISVIDMAEPLVINGTAGNDVLALTTNGTTLVVTNNGVAKNYALAMQSSITVNGLAGDDTVSFTGGMPSVTVFGGDGNDSIYAGSGNDYIDCGNGNDLVGAGPGRDTLIGLAGDDQLHGGKDNDSVDGGIGNDSLWGDMAEDVIRGGDGNDVVLRGNGNDTIWGDAGDDDLRGGLGNDVVYGGIGRDTLWGDGGSNSLDGGDDNDVIYARNSLADTVTGGAGIDQVQIDSLLDVRPLGDVETLLA